MARYLFSVLPALGHLNPTMAIASELRKRGHIVGYASGADVEPPIKNEGFDFFRAGPPGMKSDVGEEFKKATKYTGLLGTYFLFRSLLRVNRESLGDLKTIVTDFRPDVMVVDSLTFAGGEIAEFFGLKWAATSAVPGMIPSRDAPPYTTWGLPPSNNKFIRTIYGIIRFGQNVFYRMFDPEFNRIRSSLGLPPIKCGIVNTTLSPFLMLLLSCEGFEYKRSDWPPQAHLVGPAPWGKVMDDTNTFDWIDELPSDRPVIYVTLGTFQIFRSTNFFEVVIDAFRDAPYRIVIGAGHAADLPTLQNLPAHFRVERFVPHAQILPRVAAVVHHGGFGIAQDAIYHGLPSVVVPIGQDLYENARRCTEAGVALSIGFQRLTPERLRNALERILTDETFRTDTERLRAEFISKDAAATGADLLEELAADKGPIYRNTMGRTLTHDKQ